MTKLPAWHRNAPKPETPKAGDRPMWATAKDATPRPDHHKKPLDPKKCIAAGGRMRCLDCRCGKPSPKNVTSEQMPDYGTKSGHGKPKRRDPNKISDAPMYDEHVPGPDLRMPDGRMFDFKTAPKAKPKKPRKGLGKGLAELIEDGDKTPRRFRCIEDPSAGLLRMIGNKRALMGDDYEDDY